MRVAATPRMPSKVLSSSSSSSRSLRSKSRPTAVSVTRRVVRSSSRTPSACSSLSMRRLNAGCDRCTDSAALRKLLSSATARKASRSFKSKLMAMVRRPRIDALQTSVDLKDAIPFCKGGADHGLMNRVLPCVLMRAGTSRGPFFLRDWLPTDDATRDEALVGAIGASDLLQVDGVGGGSTLTSKVAIVSKSSQPECDVDYLFAQVGVGQKSVDTRPNCGNMLSGVGPFAIEQGLVPAQDGETTVRVFNVNTRSRIDVTVLTPDRRVSYDGETGIDGVAGTAAPIRLNFLDAWGAGTGSVFPTGRRIDTIDGVQVTCIDAAMPLVIVRAAALGLTGRETPAELEADRALL